jgi:hypothetical protein
VHFAILDAQALFIGHPPAPFLIRADTPLDGLYILEGSSTHWSGRTVMDINARRLRELADASNSS